MDLKAMKYLEEFRQKKRILENNYMSDKNTAYFWNLARLFLTP